MFISAVSFDKAKMYNNKMFFTNYGKDSTLSQIISSAGNNIINRVSHSPKKYEDGDKIILMRRNDYELPNDKMVFEFIERIYDKNHNLLEVKKYFKNYKIGSPNR